MLRERDTKRQMGRQAPAEQNYDVGNLELMAVKLPVEAWRRWLEGSIHPFILWTNHDHMAYIQTPQPLKSRQAIRVMLFTRFEEVFPRIKTEITLLIAQRENTVQNPLSPTLNTPVTRGIEREGS